MENYKSIKVTLIVPVLNEEDNLQGLYESIRQQELTPGIKIVEVIAVDNGSTDGSLAFSNEYCSQVFVRPNDSIADLRNFGAGHSTGDILVFTDADCVLGKDVIRNVVLLLADENTAAVGPDGLIPVGGSTWVQKTWYLHTRVLDGNDQSVEVDNLSSGFFGIKRKVFFEVGGFNGYLTIGEDTDISRKLRDHGFKLVRSNRLHVYNGGHPKTIKKFMKREYWHGDSIRHLLIHKKIESLTIYLIINALVIVCLILMTMNGFYLATISLLTTTCLLPLVKAVKKIRRINTTTVMLFIIYLLYVNSRTAALFKIK